MSSKSTPPKPSAPARDDRLKAALKSNLQKRKAQAAARGGKDKNEKAG